MSGIGDKTEYTRVYSDFLGVDLSGTGTNVSPRRLSYAENVYRDYDAEGAGVIESIPGYRRLLTLPDRVKAIYLHKPKPDTEFLLIHAGDRLYRSGAYGEGLTELCYISKNGSRGFNLGECFYIVDGEDILRIDAEGICKSLGNGISAYTPTLFHNGEAYEQRNLLTDSFYEEYTVSDAYTYAYGTEGLRYVITDSALLLCSVVGVEESVSGVLHVPGKVMLGGSYYTVYSVGESAFAYNTEITSVIIGEGVKRISDHAFRHCHGIKQITLPDSISEIGGGAFADCVNMTDVHLGASLNTVEAAAFSTCINLTQVTYSLSEDEYNLIDGISQLSNKTPTFNVRRQDLTVELPVCSEALKITEVTIDGVPFDFNLSLSDGEITAVTVKLDGCWVLNGRTARIKGELKPYLSSFSGVDDEKEKIDGYDAIMGCTIAELYDGRIFLSGNPALPNTVFYSGLDLKGQMNPFYFGAMNYFTDGLGSFPIVAMLAVRDSLAVFKSGDDGTGSIHYHTPQDTGDHLVPRVYPTEAVHSGIGAYGAALSFLDDPVFLSPLGLCALELREINLERSLVTRSHNVNLDLLREELTEAKLCEWLGYLCVGVNGNIYLADSRATFTHESGAREYEWFILKGIGSYKNATRVYRYSSVSTAKDLLVHPYPERICQGEICSRAEEGGRISYFSREGELCYSAHATDEFSGGEFYPAKCYFSDGRRLWFGTDEGAICIFNNDKRGEAPGWLKVIPDFDEEEYKRLYGGRINPSFYSFDGHAPRYAIKTAFDDCGLGHLTKSTVKRSAVIKCKSYTGANLRIEVGTDRNDYSELTDFPGGEFSFFELDFSRMSFIFGDYFTVPLGEKEKGWIEKQITVYSDSYSSPLGIYSLAYRYNVKGRIKRH